MNNFILIDFSFFEQFLLAIRNFYGGWGGPFRSRFAPKIAREDAARTYERGWGSAVLIIYQDNLTYVDSSRNERAHEYYYMFIIHIATLYTYTKLLVSRSTDREPNFSNLISKRADLFWRRSVKVVSRCTLQLREANVSR